MDYLLLDIDEHIKEKTILKNKLNRNDNIACVVALISLLIAIFEVIVLDFHLLV
jgi:hypothetical protein